MKFRGSRAARLFLTALHQIGYWKQGQWIWLFLFLVALFSFLLFTGSTSAQGELPEGELPEVGGVNLFNNHDFESGFTGWSKQGGSVGAQSCCGQHETPHWGRDYLTSPYPLDFWQTHTRNAYLFPDGQFTQLWQTHTVTQNYHYRFSVWLYTYISTATVRYYNYTTQTYTDCGSTTSTEMVLVSCEFKAAETGQMAFILQSSSVSPGVVVTDDWALTRIVKPPRWSNMPLWSALPVKYYVESGYVTRTNLVADRWNTQVGQAVFQRTSDPNQAKIKLKYGYRGYFYPNGKAMYVGGTSLPDGNGIVWIDMNRDFMDVYLSYRYGNEAREAVIGHELEHALGLDHTDYNCNMITTHVEEGSWLCSASSPTWGDAAKIRRIY